MAEWDATVPLDSVEALQEVFWKEDPDHWGQQFQVNVTGSFFTTVAFLKLLKNSNEHWNLIHPEDKTRFFSQVITVTGIAAHHRAMASFAGYGASKAALHQLMKLLSTVLASLGIRFVILLSFRQRDA
jgi:NAD(P)-dependent dehydrogenase (short-subunit alcohol dehydrogenase family)